MKRRELSGWWSEARVARRRTGMPYALFLYLDGAPPDLDRGEADRDLDRRGGRGGLVSGSHWDVYLRALAGHFQFRHTKVSFYTLSVLSERALSGGE